MNGAHLHLIVNHFPVVTAILGLLLLLAAIVRRTAGLRNLGGAGGPIEPLDWFARVHDVDPVRLLDELRDAAHSGPVPAAGPISPKMLARENLYRRFLKTALLSTFTGGTALGAWASWEASAAG